MNKKEVMDMLDKDIQDIEERVEALETEGAGEYINLDEIASVEFLEGLKENSKEFDEYLEGNLEVERMVSDYIDHFDKPTHVLVDNQLLWTPHAISMIRNVVEGR